MTELQSRLLEMFKWFHNLCEQENITYYAQAGTVLGAVRHHGFIPWDDDIDVGIPRKDYDRLREIAKTTDKSSPYVIEFPEGNNYTYGFCKVYDKRTTLVENIRGEIKRGIYLDVFPLDGVGDTMEESLKNFKRLDRCRDFFRIQSINVDKKRSFVKNAIVVVARTILGVFFNKKKVLEKIEKMCKEHDYDNSKYVLDLFGGWREKEIMDKEWVKEPILCDFEDAKIYIPNDSHSYLTRLYGDYMQLPPVEKRCSHHDYLIIDLDKSYSTL